MLKKIREYPYVWAWGRMMGSFNYYIEGQLDLAKNDNAPKNAIYKRDNGTWAFVDDVQDELRKRRLHVAVQEVSR